MSLCEQLQELRQKSQMSLQTVAERSGVPLPTVKRIFSGRTPDPSYTTVCLILTAMETTPEEISVFYTNVTTDNTGENSRLLELYERSIEAKNKWIRFLLILCLVLVSIFIFILIWDICNPNVGFFRISQEISLNALLYIVNQLHRL